MKKMVAIRIEVLLFAIFLLTACTGTLPKQTIATETAIPTVSPTLTLTSSPTLLGEYEVLSSKNMRHDLDELFHRIETTHPNPYAKRSKAEVDLEPATNL